MTAFYIDADNHLHADWYAGQENALSTFVARVDWIMREYKPRTCALAFDCGRSFRHNLIDDYKPNRREKPEYLATLLKSMPGNLRADGYRVCMAEGYEAEDIIATLTRESLLRNEKVVIVSGDKDCRQLLRRDRVTQLRKVSRQKGGEVDKQWYTADDLHEEFGLTPEQYLDLQCLAGDSTDGIKGCEGIGDKGACELLRKYGSLEYILDHVDTIKVTEKKREALREFRECWDVHMQLVKLRSDAPIY